MSNPKGSYTEQRDRLLEKRDKWDACCTNCKSQHLEFHVLNRSYRPALKDNYENLPIDITSRLRGLPTLIDFAVARAQGANVDIQIQCLDCNQTESDFINVEPTGERVAVTPSIARLKKYLQKYYNYYEDLML